jgi:hypothetical protein
MTGGAAYPFDTEPEITLRNGLDSAETASANETPISLKPSGGAYWQNHSQTFIYSAAVIHVTELDKTDGDETYAIKVEVSTDQGFSSPVVVDTVTITDTGEYVITLHGPTIEKIAPGANYVRVGCTLGGTTPSIKYYAWLAPVVNGA